MAIVATATLVPFLLMPTEDLWRVETMMAMMGILFAMLFVNIVIFAVKFETRVTSDGIYYKYPPLIWKWKLAAYHELREFHIRKYNACREFGGLGYKTKPFSKSKAIIIKGNQGLQLTFKNGKRLLLGTQKPEALRLALKKARGED
jgi:hypothetical protein